MPFNCPQAISKLKAYKQQHQKLKTIFDDLLSQAPFLPDVKWDEPFMSSPYYKKITEAPKEIFDNLYDTKEEARKKLEELRELSGYPYLFIVKDALSPYGYWLHPLNERRDIKINLQELLTQDKDAYRQAGLTEWVNDLPDNIQDLKLTPQQLENLKSRIEQGEIPIFMPGRLAQLKGLTTAITKLKPIFVDDGKKQEVEDSDHWDHIDKLMPFMIQIAELIKNNRSLSEEAILELKKQLAPLIGENPGGQGLLGQSLLEISIRNIPEKPYIFTSEFFPKRANNLYNQREKLKEIQELNPKLLIDCMSIGEYLSLQNRFTNRLAKHQLEYICPLDNNSRSFSIRCSSFMNFPMSPNGQIPCGAWDSSNSRISLGSVYHDSKDCEHFRVSVRI